MYRRDELAHMGVKGMKWRRRKSAVANGADVGNNITNVYANRQAQLINRTPGSKLGTKNKTRGMSKGYNAYGAIMKAGIVGGAAGLKEDVKKPTYKRKNQQGSSKGSSNGGRG